MRKQIPVILLLLITALLSAALFSANQKIRTLKKTLAGLQDAEHEAPPQTAAGIASEPEISSAGNEAAVLQPVAATDEPVVAEAVSETDSKRRVMSNMAKAIEENPTINKMVEASQRGAMGALYGDMIEYLELDAEEARYFMELIMHRQMANVDVHLKMMSGDLSEEEKAALTEKARAANETTNREMEKFLNDPEDFAEFEYYEDTIGERMMLSQMDQMLGDHALDEGTYREVLSIMHDERENYTWRTDLHDDENRDLSPERFSEENIRKHIEDTKILGERMDQRMQVILTPDQLAAWRESGLAMQNLVEGQLRQAGQMFSEE